METIYRKVAVTERIPKEKEMLMTSHGWSLWNGKQFEDEDDKPISYINYWLEEIHDPTSQLQADKAELLEILMQLCDLKYIKDLDGKTPYYLEQQPLAWTKAKSIIQKHKQ